MDDKRMTPISKLAEIDPVFREVVSKLFPEIDPREMWDISKLHNSDDKNNNKKALAGGLLFGAAAEGAAVARAGKGAFGRKVAPGEHEPRHLVSPKQGELFKPKLGRMGAVKGALKAHAGKGEFALQAANMAIGLGAARELLKKPKPVSKAEFMDACQPIIKARQDGIITTQKALDLIEEIEKGLLFDWKAGAQAVRHPKQYRAALHLADTKKAADAEKFREDTNKSIHAGRIMVGTGVAATAGGMGISHGRKAHRTAMAENAMMAPKTQEISAKATVKKSEEVDYGFTGEISKFDEDKRQVFGWCSLSTVDGKPVVDLQNDYISIEEVEKAAYSYAVKSRKGGDMHARVGDAPVHTSDMIESVVITPDKLIKMGVPEEAVSKVHTGWWVGFQVNDDDQWSKVKTGERTGFSIHGKGIRKDMMLED